MLLNTSPSPRNTSLSPLTPFLPIHRLTGPQRCPHYGPLQEPPQCPSKAEWHSIAMEKLSRLCDWLLVHKEVSAVWGPLGRKLSEAARENNNDWIRERKEGKKQRRAGQSTPPLIASNQKDLLISHSELFNPLPHIKPLDINRFHCSYKCICITKCHIRQFHDGTFACFHPHRGK